MGYRQVAFAVFIGAATAVLSAQSRAQEPAAISGVVIDDRGAPVPEALVFLGPPGPPSRPSYCLSDSLGRFVFTGVQAGTYFINVGAAGHEEAHYGVQSMGVIGSRIVVRPGEWFSEARITAPRLARLSGRANYASGDDAVGVIVRVIAVHEVAGVRRLASGPVARTDDRGAFAFDSLPTGKYYVQVLMARHTVDAALSTETANAGANRASASTAIPGLGVSIVGASAIAYSEDSAVTSRSRIDAASTFFPSEPDLSSAVLVDLAPGSERDIAVTIRDRVTVRVSGRLLREPLKPLLLRLVSEGLEDLALSSAEATTVLHQDGSFEFLDVPIGNYTLIAAASMVELQTRANSADRRTPPAAPGSERTIASVSGGLVSAYPALGYRAQSSAGDSDFVIWTPLAVGTEGLSNVEITVEQTGRVRVFVVSDEATTPEQGQLELASNDAEHGLSVRLSAAPTRSGEGTDFAGLRRGAYALRIVGATGYSIKAIETTPASAVPEEIHVAPGQTTTVVVTVTKQVIRLSGSVTTEKGAAVAPATVILVPTDRSRWVGYGLTPTWIRTSTGTSAGTYEINNIRAGTYFVVAVPETQVNAWSDPKFLQEATRTATTIALTWGQRATLDLRLAVQ